ncbi:hypothetical protein [Enterococcus sp.]|uniref:hypothetical protein n=1 Tax=Enterococcus sp. TaxID=35783 RepID=UPI002FCAE19F
MKKIFTPAVLLLTVFALGACASNGNNNSSSDSLKETTATETVETDSTEAQEMVFTATVVSVTELGTSDPSIQILLEEPVAVTDTEDSIGSFQNGVALNVDPTTLTMDVEELAVGSELKVTLAQPAVMTMSIPPQVPGNSIISIELIK